MPNKPHVHVLPGQPTALRPGGVVDEAGDEHRTDVIVYATGFHTAGSYDRIRIEGDGGLLLEEAWRAGMHSYNGVAVSGFPNMFLLLGPNSVVAYTGVVTMVEAQARYVVRAIRTTRKARARALAVRSEAQDRFQQTVRDKYACTIWAVGGCRSWYQNRSPSGTLLWPDSTVAYSWRLRRVRRGDFQFLPE